MVTKLYLIRHGETEGAETKRYKGHMDVPLSGNGIRQMERVAEYLSEEAGKRESGEATREFTGLRASGLSAVYTSDLSRAIKSAEIIAEPHGLRPVVTPELKERNFGVWEGMTFDEIKEKWPDEFEAWTRNPLAFSPVRGESTIEVRDRGMKALEKILSQSKDDLASTAFRKGGTGGFESIAIVAHGGINRIILCELLGMPLENIFRIEQNFGCLNMIELWDNYPVVKLINFTA